MADGERIEVVTDSYGVDADDGPDVVVVRVDGEEVGAYSIADDPEVERAAMERMIRAVARAGAESMRRRAVEVCESVAGDMAQSRDEGAHYAARECASLLAALPLVEPEDG